MIIPRRAADACSLQESAGALYIRIWRLDEDVFPSLYSRAFPDAIDVYARADDE